MSNLLFKDLAYDKGYGDGYKTGYNKALEDMEELLGIVGDRLEKTRTVKTDDYIAVLLYDGVSDFAVKMREKLSILRKT